MKNSSDKPAPPQAGFCFLNFPPVGYIISDQGAQTMQEIQTDVSNRMLVDAIRLNMCEFFRYFSKDEPAERFENERFVRWYTPVAHPWFNGVVCSIPPVEQDHAFVKETIQYFREKRVRLFTWWMEPPLQASEWEEVLSKHGFGFSNGTPGMAMDLHEMNESRQPVDGFDIRIVSDAESLRQWVKVFVKGFGLPADWEEPWFQVAHKMGLDFPNRSYLGYLNGQAVSTSSVFYGGGVAGIYCVATVPEARGKGIGAAMTLKPLQEARSMGCRVGILQSSEMGYPVYKRLGFKHLCQIENFYLTFSS
jgi:GNAT superfamily N-acetyltransferase